MGRVSTSSRTYGSTAHYGDEKSTCLDYFMHWTENEQIDFVEHLLSRMCHYQHGHINQYLKPMLQRDFISALPGFFLSVSFLSLCSCLSVSDCLWSCLCLCSYLLITPCKAREILAHTLQTFRGSDKY